MDRRGPAVASDASTPPNTTEHRLSEMLAEILGVDHVPATADFFDDLGTDSMGMAQFCARMRKREDLPSASIKQVYQHSSIRLLTAALVPQAAEPIQPAYSWVEQMVQAVRAEEHLIPELTPTLPAESGTASPQSHHAPPGGAESPAASPVGYPFYALCGVLQFLITVGLTWLGAVVVAEGYQWISDASGWADTYQRAAVYAAATFLGWALLPIVAKWTLVGRWKSGQFPVWSLTYVRFWLVKLLVQRNPLVLFAGSPIFNLYLRALGARIGTRAVILARTVPVCTDLFTVGAGAIIRKDTVYSCYRAQAGMIQTGPVTIGQNAFVGESAVLDIDTSLGDRAQLGHASSLYAGQSIAADERLIGSPAQQNTTFDYRAVDPIERSKRNRVVYPLLQLAFLLAVTLPLGASVLSSFAEWRIVPDVLSGESTLSVGDPTLYRDALILAAVVFFGAPLARLALALTVPRLLNRALNPGTVYPLYGVHYWIHRVIARTTNLKFFMDIVGDSSYVGPYLKLIGYNTSLDEPTGADFGQGVKHDNPYLVNIGPGTMIADGISFITTDYSDTSFRVAPVTIGGHSFFGNHIAYPPQGKTGENCLHATKVLIPVEGEVRENVGFLGSPDFEIPRTVMRDHEFDHFTEGDEWRSRLTAKNRHNLVSMLLHVLARWLRVFVLALLLLGGLDLFDRFGALSLVVASLIGGLVGPLYAIGVERAMTRFMDFRPIHCSMYERDSWMIERFWKLTWQPRPFNGTPLKGLAYRLQGVRVGKRLFDDGSFISEKLLVTIGDDCTLNAGSTLQAHSQEDGNFKADHIEIGSDCTVGVGALVHYGTTIGDGATVGAASFLMKGSNVLPNTYWGENPARELTAADNQETTITLDPASTSTEPFTSAPRENRRHDNRSHIRT